MVDSTKLIGKYKTPKFRYGDVVTCAVRGEVVITGLSDGKIPWPIGGRSGSQGRSLVIFGDLERALRTEANVAVCRWWGVTPSTVSHWRAALGIGYLTPGLSRLRREEIMPRAREMVALVDHSDPVRNAKIAASKIGKPRPRHVIEILRRANLGRPLSPEHRRKISERNRATGNRPPIGKLWTGKEDRMVRKLPPAEVAKRTGRSLGAVYQRRLKLKRTDAVGTPHTADAGVGENDAR